MVVSLAGLMPLPPLLQDQSYHQFADQRTLFGIPNFWNVVSNLPFIAIGAAGLLLFRRDAITVVLFSGILLPVLAHPITIGIRTTARCSGTGCR